MLIKTVIACRHMLNIKAHRDPLTLLGDLDLPASEVGLFDVLDAEISIALRVLLLLVTGRCLVI